MVTRRMTAATLLLTVAAAVAVDAQQRGRYPGAATYRDQRSELAMKITQPFTLAAVGDMIQFQPFSHYTDPDIQALVAILRGADMTVANFEGKVYDFDTFGTTANNLGTKEVADDWVHMGIKMMTNANNHTLDAGDAGILENLRQAERVGIVHVGAARSLPLARMARVTSTPKGLFAFAGIYAPGGTADGGASTGTVVPVTDAQLAQVRSMKAAMLAREKEVDNPLDPLPPDPADAVTVFGVTFRVGGAAAAAPTTGRGAGSGGRGEAGGRGEGGGRAGGENTVFVNNLKVTQWNGVTADQMTQLRAIAGDHGSGNELKAFGTQFRVMAKPGEYSYDMDPQDEREILAAIRTGKQFADMEASNIHWHQNRYAFQHYSFDHYPADYEIRFAHEAIDNGDDVFIGDGVHTIKGVEIYHGKPIFYGVSNFVFQSQIMPATVAGRTAPPAPPGRAKDAIVGDGEMNEDLWAWLQKPANLEVLLTTSHFENGQLTEVRIYPVDIGLTPRPGSQFGIPKRPTPEIARRILEHVVEYSKPFNTKITIENGVGVIRIPPAAKH